MLGGQSGFNAFRESYQGVLIIDGCLWPPAEIGALRHPIRLEIENGFIHQIGGDIESHLFARWLKAANHPQAYLLDHACYGFNPGVSKPSGRILEDERVFGCMQFGLGAPSLGSPVHSDGVVLNPSVWLDDLQIEAEGRYIHPDLVRMCQAMDAPGY